MSSEHAHLNQDASVITESRVGTHENQKTIALAATSSIPGAKQVIEDYFDRSSWKMPYTLPGKKHINQVMHLGW